MRDLRALFPETAIDKVDPSAASLGSSENSSSLELSGVNHGNDEKEPLVGKKRNRSFGEQETEVT